MRRRPRGRGAGGERECLAPGARDLQPGSPERLEGRRRRKTACAPEDPPEKAHVPQVGKRRAREPRRGGGRPREGGGRTGWGEIWVLSAAPRGRNLGGRGPESSRTLCPARQGREAARAGAPRQQAGGGPARPQGTQRHSPSRVRLARAPFAFGRLLSNSFSIASW